MNHEFLALSVTRNDCSEFGFEKEAFIKCLVCILEKNVICYAESDYEKSPYPVLNLLFIENTTKLNVESSAKNSIKSALLDFGVDEIDIEYRGNLYKYWECYKRFTKK